MFNKFFFVIRHGLQLERIHPVEAPKITIGRSDDCSLRLVHYGVSRPHACVEQTERGFLIRDLSSRNGTMVNQRVIESHLLQEFDIVRIAPFSLKVFLTREHAEADAEASEDSTRSLIIEPSSTDIREELKKRLIPSLHRVYDGLVDGYCEKDIARLCGLSKHTVHSYVKRIYEILDVHSHTELMDKCRDRRCPMD